MTPASGGLDEIARGQRGARALSRAFGWAAVVVGLLVCIGWVLDIPALRFLFPRYPEMRMNAALAFILCGAPLALAEQPDGWRAPVRKGCAAVVIVIAALTLIEYAAGVSLGIDQLLIADHSGSALNP